MKVENHPKVRHCRAVMRWQAARRGRGECIRCGAVRGENGTKLHCRPCAEKWNKYRRDRRKTGSAD
jgi:hypothetical protein